jgi:hypothetical protein
MGSHDEAAAAIDGLDSKFVWEGMGGPMVVKWMDAELQRRRREEHLAAMRQVGQAARAPARLPACCAGSRCEHVHASM